TCIIRRQLLGASLGLPSLPRTSALTQQLRQVVPAGGKVRLLLDRGTQGLLCPLLISGHIAPVTQGKPGQRLLRPGLAGTPVGALRRLHPTGLLQVTRGSEPAVHVGLSRQLLRW